MAKRKRSREADEALLRSQAARLNEAEPLLPISQALQQSIDARLGGDPGDALLDVDGAWDAALEEVAARIITSRLEELDPLDVLRLYAERAGDDALAAKLERWAADKADALDVRERIERLRAESARSGSVALAELDEGVRLRIGLFDIAQISQARRESSIPPARTIELRLLRPADGYVQVISDTQLPFSAEEGFRPHRRGSVGSDIAEGERHWLEATLQVGAPLGYDFGDGAQSTRQVIGFVEAETACSSPRPKLVDGRRNRLLASAQSAPGRRAPSRRWV